MGRVIDEKTFARLIEHLLKDEAIALFQDLLLSKKIEDEEIQEKDHRGDE